MTSLIRPLIRPSPKRPAVSREPVCATVQTGLDIERLVKQSQRVRSSFLEVQGHPLQKHCTPADHLNPMMQAQALETLKTAVEKSEHPVFPCALIAGDVVILDLLSKLDYLKSAKVQVAFIDTFHLFPETITFLKELEVQ